MVLGSVSGGDKTAWQMSGGGGRNSDQPLKLHQFHGKAEAGTQSYSSMPNKHAGRQQTMKACQAKRGEGGSE